MRVLKFISLMAIIMLVSSFALAQAAPAESAPAVKHIPITNAPSNSGPEMFKTYCAVCHGSDARGNGPAAAALKAQPADLTLLAQKNGGKYPSSHVAAVLRGQATMPSHGSEDMPIWGPLFSSLSQGHEGQVQQRTSNLVAYIGSLQAK